MTNPDITLLINSEEIQSIVRPISEVSTRRARAPRRNPLVNKAALFRLNPYAKVHRKHEAGSYMFIGLTYFIVGLSALFIHQHVKLTASRSQKLQDPLTRSSLEPSLHPKHFFAIFLSDVYLLVESDRFAHCSNIKSECLRYNMNFDWITDT